MAKVTTWADGFGMWHASVPISGSRHKDAMTARAAIVAEVKFRYDAWNRTLDPSAVRVTRERVTNHGTVIYKEV